MYLNTKHNFVILNYPMFTFFLQYYICNVRLFYTLIQSVSDERKVDQILLMTAEVPNNKKKIYPMK